MLKIETLQIKTAIRETCTSLCICSAVLAVASLSHHPDSLLLFLEVCKTREQFLSGNSIPAKGISPPLAGTHRLGGSTIAGVTRARPSEKLTLIPVLCAKPNKEK